MNANEISPKASFRMNRIQKVSGVFRVIFVVVILLCVFDALVIAVEILKGHREYVLGSWFEVAREIARAACAWFGYKLFDSYSRGELFTSKIVYFFRRIGCLYLLMAVFAVFSKMVSIPSEGWKFYLVYSVVLIFDLFPGFLILFIAWVMDEGRKIREEQELTV
jgi:hypothetical protein